jgi:hypothetical protein
MSTPQVQMATSDFNLQTLTTGKLSKHVEGCIKIGGNIAIFGRRGTGKTEISKQEIKNANMHEVYMNLSVFERTDMGGYPNIMSQEVDRKYVSFLLPSFYQKMIEGNTPVVALLDEVDKADPSLWAPLLEFTQFHTIGGRHLPNLAAIIMTGNLISEGGMRPSLPLLDRSEKYLVEADAASWLEWSGKVGGIHPSIISYITDNPKDLFGSVDPEDRYADPSPRGWARASAILFGGESLGWDSDLLNDKVCGCIGKETGIRYRHYYEHYKQLLPMIEDVFKGMDVMPMFNKLEPTKKLIACMITCTRVATILDSISASDPNRFDKVLEMPIITNVGNFLEKVSYENALVTVRSQIQLTRIVNYRLDFHPAWKGFLTKIHQKANS